MSRRKQSKPIRHLDSEDATPLCLDNAASTDDSKDDKTSSILDQTSHNQTVFSESSDVEDCATSPDTPSCDSDNAPTSFPQAEDETPSQCTSNSSLGSLLNMSSTPIVPGLLSSYKSVDTTSESVPAANIALTQLMATAIAKNIKAPSTLQDISTLQPSMLALQRQKMLQLNFIHHLQSKMRDPQNEEQSECDVEKVEIRDKNEHPKTATPSSAAEENSMPLLESGSAQNNKSLSQPDSEIHQSNSLVLGANDSDVVSELSPQRDPSSSSSYIASAVIQPSDDAQSSMGNSLEMLQKTTQQVLSNASQGLLASNMVDDMYQRGKTPIAASDRKDESFFKHRCRYCGKVFGSDSALQIHIRSHTGERPYKCNICGNRFTTKGNLKVHFQRHRDRFPHVKMNPNMVPEHLDKFYPPLLAQLGELPDTPQPPVPPPHFGSPLLGPPALYSRALNDDSSLNDPDKPSTQASAAAPKICVSSFSPVEATISTDRHEVSILKEKTVLDLRTMDDHSVPKFAPIQLKRPIEEDASTVEMKKSCTSERQASTENIDTHTVKHDTEIQEPNVVDSDSTCEELDKEHAEGSSSDANKDENTSQDPIDKPQNLSRTAESLIRNQCKVPVLPPSLSQRIPASFPFSMPLTTFPQHPFPFPGHFSPIMANINLTSNVDPCKDPIIYTNLLPKPGINDNAWEALIEIEKTSETSKLQQLVDNIENKITDPNQCVICQRVLSCKSALQMHYRTHTGERPFKCKICGRAFTTKGNLKTHMGVHRSKPPMRMTHQCPVCHKRFQNGLVLQQHIRLHTGERTDMSPEQIAAGELIEPLLPFPPPPLIPGAFPLPPSQMPNFSQFSGFPLSLPLPRSISPSDDIAPEVGYRSDESADKPLHDDSDTSERHLNVSNLKKNESINGDRSDGSADEFICSPTTEDGRGCSPEVNDHNRFTKTPIRHIDNVISQRLADSLESPHMPLDLTPQTTASISASPLPSVSHTITSFFRPPLASMRPAIFPPPLLSLGSFPLGQTFHGVPMPVFACHSALDIHYRSHTKERPFKCPECGKAFSTKGNMKQHMSIHRDTGAVSLETANVISASPNSSATVHEQSQGSSCGSRRLSGSDTKETCESSPTESSRSRNTINDDCTADTNYDENADVATGENGLDMTSKNLSSGMQSMTSLAQSSAHSSARLHDVFHVTDSAMVATEAL